MIRPPRQDELFKVMNGTGPYKLERWAPNEEIDLVRNDNYWLRRPRCGKARPPARPSSSG